MFAIFLYRKRNIKYNVKNEFYYLLYRIFLRVCVSVNTITKSMNIYLIIRVYSSYIEINQKLLNYPFSHK